MAYSYICCVLGSLSVTESLAALDSDQQWPKSPSTADYVRATYKPSSRAGAAALRASHTHTPASNTYPRDIVYSQVYSYVNRGGRREERRETRGSSNSSLNRKNFSAFRRSLTYAPGCVTLKRPIPLGDGYQSIKFLIPYRVYATAIVHPTIALGLSQNSIGFAVPRSACRHITQCKRLQWL